MAAVHGFLRWLSVMRTCDTYLADTTGCPLAHIIEGGGSRALLLRAAIPPEGGAKSSAPRGGSN